MTRYAQTRTGTTQLYVAGRYCGTWAKSEGFELSTDEIRYGEAPPATGVRTRGNATLRRPYSDADVAMELFLEANIGQEAVIIRNRQGDDGQPLGANPRTFKGRCLGVTPPDQDQTASERAELTCMFVLEVDAS